MPPHPRQRGRRATRGSAERGSPQHPRLLRGAADIRNIERPAAELAENLKNVCLWAKDTWIAEESAEWGMWESALPFVRLLNGDYVALDRRTTDTDPPVAYLCHEDDSFLLSPNLVALLTAWEGLCYIGPEHWLLRPFTDDAGKLDAESERAARLRELLGG